MIARWRGAVAGELRVRPFEPAATDHTDLLTDGIAIRDGFLSAPQVRQLNECAQLRRARGEFREARVGNGRGLRRRESIRGDSTCWLDRSLFEAESALFRDLERLRLGINSQAYLGLFDLELHYAWYPRGTAYARHVDRPYGRGRREVSIVLYLNEAWEREAGGALRLFGEGGGFSDIEPVGGRLVYFMTAGREHEVLPTRRDRLSISGWFLRRDP